MQNKSKAVAPPNATGIPTQVVGSNNQQPAVVVQAMNSGERQTLMGVFVGQDRMNLH
jgi:hypothetical protein